MARPFAPSVHMLPLTTIVYRLLWSALIGAAVGVERNIRRRPAGMRTSMCVCIGSALFTILSVEISKLYGDSSPTRIASNIVQGIGFLGAGVILRDRGSIVGLTTAATIFVEAAIGMAAGGGLYKVAGVSGALLLFALAVMVPVENTLNLKRRYIQFQIIAEPGVDILPDVRKLLAEMSLKLNNLTVATQEGRHTISFDAAVSHHQQDKILASVARSGVSCEMKPVEWQYE